MKAVAHHNNMRVGKKFLYSRMYWKRINHRGETLSRVPGPRAAKSEKSLVNKQENKKVEGKGQDSYHSGSMEECGKEGVNTSLQSWGGGFKNKQTK